MPAVFRRPVSGRVERSCYVSLWASENGGHFLLAALLQKAFVVAHRELTVDLFHRLESDADGDEQRRAGEGVLREAPERQEQRRQQRDEGEEQRAWQRDA